MKKMLLYWILGPIAGTAYGLCGYALFFTNVCENHPSLLFPLFFAGLLLLGLAIWCFWTIFRHAKKQWIAWQKNFMIYLLIAGILNLILFCYSFVKLLTDLGRI